MSNHNLCSKVDRALVAYLVSVGAGTADDVWPAKRSLNKSLPCTVCWSHSATPPNDDPYSGNRMVEAFIEVRSSGVVEQYEEDDYPRQVSEARVSATFDAFNAGLNTSSAELANAITSAARATGASDLLTLTLLACRVAGETQGFNPRSPRTEGQAWVDVIHLEILAAPSNVS